MLNCASNSPRSACQAAAGSMPAVACLDALREAPDLCLGGAGQRDAGGVATV